MSPEVAAIPFCERCRTQSFSQGDDRLLSDDRLISCVRTDTTIAVPSLRVALRFGGNPGPEAHTPTEGAPPSLGSEDTGESNGAGR